MDGQADVVEEFTGGEDMSRLPLTSDFHKDTLIKSYQLQFHDRVEGANSDYEAGPVIEADEGFAARGTFGTLAQILEGMTKIRLLDVREEGGAGHVTHWRVKSHS